MFSEVDIECPYCWEHFTYFFSPEDAQEAQVTDCEVCCHAIEISIKKSKKTESGYRSIASKHG